MGRTADQDERLARVLLEQLKTPLLHIVHQAQLRSPAAFQEIGLTAGSALRLIDGLTLAEELSQVTLELEPVAVSSVLYDVAEDLRPLAEQYDCRLEIRMDGKYGPVMADRRSLETALISLGHGFIEAAAESETPAVVLAVFKSEQGISTGLFSRSVLNTDTFRRAMRLYGRARHAMPALQTTAGAGLYVAEALFEAMAAPLSTTRHRNLNGLAATFLPSIQTSLV